jgi:hypothetical protein
VCVGPGRCSQGGRAGGRADGRVGGRAGGRAGGTFAIEAPQHALCCPGSKQGQLPVCREALGSMWEHVDTSITVAILASSRVSAAECQSAARHLKMPTSYNFGSTCPHCDTDVEVAVVMDFFSLSPPVLSSLAIGV